MLYYSKLAISFGLYLLNSKAFTAPAVLKDDDKKEDSLFKGDSMETMLRVTRLLVPAGVSWLAYSDPAWTGYQPWSESDVMVAAVAFVCITLRLWAMDCLGRHFTFVVGVVKDHEYVVPIFATLNKLYSYHLSCRSATNACA